jgi:hypothetical protein
LFALGTLDWTAAGGCHPPAAGRSCFWRGGRGAVVQTPEHLREGGAIGLPVEWPSGSPLSDSELAAYERYNAAQFCRGDVPALGPCHVERLLCEIKRLRGLNA